MRAPLLWIGQFIRRRWVIFVLGLLASPFVLLHLLVLIAEWTDVPIPGTRRLSYTQPDGTPLIAYRRDSVAGQTPLTTIVFVHGTPASASAFSSQFGPDLFPDCDLISYDRPGFGGSPGGDEKANLDYQTQALLNVLKQIRTPHAVLVGHSYGAPVAVQAATQEPDRISGVLLIGGCLSPEEEHPWAIQYFGNWPIICRLLPEPARASNQELLQLKADLIHLDILLPNFKCPLLMLHGTVDNQVPVENVAYTQNRFAQLGKTALFFSHIYPGYNHFMMWEHPADVNSQIQVFVDSVTKR